MNIEQQRATFEAYLKDCDIHGIVPDTAGAFNYAWQAAIELDRQGRGEPVCFANINKQGDVTRTSKRPDGWSKTPLYTAPQPANPAIKESLTVAEPVPLTTMRRQMLRNVIHEVGQRSRCKGDYNDQVADLLSTIAADPQPAEPVKAPSDEDLQALWNDACNDTPQRPGWSRHLRYGRALLARYGQPAQPATCGAPISDKPACGAQNAECERQPALRDWEISCGECCGSGHVRIKRQVAERDTDVITSREPCEVCDERGYVIAHEDVPGIEEYVDGRQHNHLPDAAKMVGQAGDARDAARYRFAAEHIILTGGATKFGWPLAPIGKKQWDKYLDRAMQQERQP